MIATEIKRFLDQPAKPNDLVAFAHKLLQEYPSERRFIQEWFISMVISSQFSGILFADVVLTRQASFTLDARALGAREIYREKVL